MITKKENYSQEEINEMREALCQRELEWLTDESDIWSILMDGCVGWDNVEEETIIQEFEEYMFD
jgi:hypothetical protein